MLGTPYLYSVAEKSAQGKRENCRDQSPLGMHCSKPVGNRRGVLSPRHRSGKS